MGDLSQCVSITDAVLTNQDFMPYFPPVRPLNLVSASNTGSSCAYGLLLDTFLSVLSARSKTPSVSPGCFTMIVAAAF